MKRDISLGSMDIPQKQIKVNVLISSNSGTIFSEIKLTFYVKYLKIKQTKQSRRNADNPCVAGVFLG